MKSKKTNSLLSVIFLTFQLQVITGSRLTLGNRRENIHHYWINASKPFSSWKQDKFKEFDKKNPTEFLCELFIVFMGNLLMNLLMVPQIFFGLTGATHACTCICVQCQREATIYSN